jgi:hypothetical protein
MQKSANLKAPFFPYSLTHTYDENEEDEEDEDED